jgi:hypothetical protein
MNRYIFLLTSISFLISCTALDITPNTTVTDTPAIPAETPIFLNRTTTPSPRPTLAPLPISSVTLTALPTLTTAETENYLLGLYNNNCSLPCWGGFVPGRITWLEVKQQLEAANVEIYSPNPKVGSAAYFQIPRLGVKSSIGFWVATGIVEMIRPQILSRTYDLIPLLFEYGKPDEVWISAYPASGPPNYVLFGIILFYKKGISVLYSYTGSVGQDHYTICPTQQQTEDYPMLFVWEEGRFSTLKEFESSTEVFGITIREKFLYKPLEETTETSIEELYDGLVMPGSNYCIKTPKANWQ